VPFAPLSFKNTPPTEELLNPIQGRIYLLGRDKESSNYSLPSDLSILRSRVLLIPTRAYAWKEFVLPAQNAGAIAIAIESSAYFGSFQVLVWR